MRPPGFERLAGAVLEEFGQPVRIRPDMAADPVVQREVTGMVRSSTVSAVMYGRNQQPLGTRLILDELDCDDVVVDRCEFDVSRLIADPAGSVRVLGETFRIDGWVTFLAAGGAEDGIGEDGLYRIYRLQKKP